jgi:hypothetical protein
MGDSAADAGSRPDKAQVLYIRFFFFRANFLTE